MPFELPKHLKHRPVRAIDYENFDGVYAGESDAKYLTVGLAQYDQSELTAKVFRHTGGKWSRQSEELPAHRLVDLCILLTHVIAQKETVAAGTYLNQTEDIHLTDETSNAAERQLFQAFMEKLNDPTSESPKNVKAQLGKLTDLLLELRAEGRI